MKFLTLILSIILCAALLGMPSTGCESLGIHPPASTQPLIARDRVDAAQHDLNTAWAAARLANALGAFTPEQWKVIETNVASAQAAINLAYVAVDEKPKDLELLLNAATDAVVAFKQRSAPG